MIEHALDGLACEDEFPLTWSVVEVLPAEERLATLNATNEALVRSCDGLEEGHKAPDDAPDMMYIVQRIEFKMDLILELLAQRLQLDEALPKKYPVRLNAHGLCWAQEDTPEPGTLLRLECYVCSSIPRPMVVFGRVVRKETTVDPENACGPRTTVQFEGVSPGLEDAIERLVFRRHRREVAHLRGLRRQAS